MHPRSPIDSTGPTNPPILGTLESSIFKRRLVGPSVACACIVCHPPGAGTGEMFDVMMDDFSRSRWRGHYMNVDVHSIDSRRTVISPAFFPSVKRTVFRTRDPTPWTVSSIFNWSVQMLRVHYITPGDPGRCLRDD